jgi:tetratricopeptide (TPR) repeat protein
MGLCFLAAVYAALRGFAAESPTRWFRASAAASLLAVLAKEIGVIAPLVILLYDGYVVSGGLGRALGRHRPLYLGLAWSWVVAGLLQLGAPRGSSVTLAAPGLGPLGYLSRQPGALLTYLKLVFWPSPLVFDYGDPPPAPAPFALVVSATVVLALVVASVLALRRSPRAGWAGVSFFLILSPTSTVIPIVTEVVAEHRMYLPLAAVLGIVVAGAVTLGRRLADAAALPPAGVKRLGWVLVLAAAVALGVCTRQRNEVYGSELALWRDTAAEEPRNPRALSNLGMAFYEAGRMSDAQDSFSEALAIRPDDFNATGGLALALEGLGQAGEALGYMRRAVRLDPSSQNARQGVVRLAMKLGRVEDALQAARSYVERFPESADANGLYGSLLLRVGRAADAAPFLRRARELSTGASRR